MPPRQTTGVDRMRQKLRLATGFFAGFVLAQLLLLSGPAEASPFQGPTILVDDPRIKEGDTNAETPVVIDVVQLSAVSAGPVTMSWQTADGTAFAGVDYAAASGTITILPGELVGRATVNIWGGIGDSEVDEIFYIDLSNPSGGVLNDTQSEVTIGNDDNVWTPVSKVAVAEGSPGLGPTLVITTTLSPSAPFTSTFQYKFEDGTADKTTDFADGVRTVTFPALSTTQVMTVTISGDSRVEPDEAFFVEIFNEQNAWIPNPIVTGIIVDDDNNPTVYDGFGGVHGTGVSPATPVPPYYGFDAGRDLEYTDDGYHALDGFGGLHAGGGASPLSQPTPYFGIDVAVDLEFLCDGSGFYVLDKFGGLHAGGGATAPNPLPPYFGFEAAADMEPTCPGSGVYVLDRFGGLHAAGDASLINPAPPYFGFPIAVDLEIPCVGVGAWVLDGFGGLHPAGGAPSPSPAPPYFGIDAAADMEIFCPTTQLMVLDRLGGLHVGGGAMPVYIRPPYFGFPIAWDFEGNH